LFIHFTVLLSFQSRTGLRLFPIPAEWEHSTAFTVWSKAKTRTEESFIRPTAAPRVKLLCSGLIPQNVSTKKPLPGGEGGTEQGLAL